MTTNADIPSLIMWELVSLIFVGIGIYLVRTPARKILEWDRRTGWSVYQRELKASGDEQRALAKAGRVYYWFGLFFASFAALHCVVAGILLAVLLLGGKLNG